MSNILSYGAIVIIIVGWIYYFIKRKSKAIVFLIYSSVIYFNYSSAINIDLIIKILFLATAISSIIKYGIRKKSIIVLFCLLLLFLFGTIMQEFTDSFLIMDSVTAYISTLLGFIISSINWPTDDRIDILKKIAYIPIYSVIIGIFIIPLKIVPFFTRAGNVGVGGASMATNLSFYCITSIMSSLIVYIETKDNKYRLISYINLIIQFLTLTRTGILVSIIVMFPDIYSWVKESMILKHKFIITIILIVISIVPAMNLGHMLIERSFSNGKFSSSGRFEAWEYIVSIIDNKLIGNGMGNLKTVNDSGLSSSFNASHNEYVRIYYETGYIGIIIHILLFYYSFNWILYEKNIIDNKSIGLFVLGFLLYSLTDNTITNYRSWIPFVFVIAITRERKKVE